MDLSTFAYCWGFALGYLCAYMAWRSKQVALMEAYLNAALVTFGLAVGVLCLVYLVTLIVNRLLRRQVADILFIAAVVILVMGLVIHGAE